MNNFTPWGIVNETEILQFEQRIGFSLPADYRQFLAKNNGGNFKNEFFILEENEQRVLLDVLYGITNKEKSLLLDTWLAEYKDELQKDALIIGSDPGGGMLLCIAKGDDMGIYYWDHAHSFPESSKEEGNTYFVAESFTDLCSLLRPYSVS